MKMVIVKNTIIEALITSAVIIVFNIMPLLAELPIKFIYQGNLREKGILVNGVRQMQFAIYDSTSSSTPLWTSQIIDVSISTGVFRVIIEPNISSNYLNGILYLELTVNGQKLSPREQILPSVYTLNTLYHEGKRYYTSILPPSNSQKGDLWFNTNDNNLYYYNGVQWISASASIPQPHHISHEPGGTDVITKLSTITFEGGIIISTGYSITTLSQYLNISTNVSITGYLNVSSSIYASKLYGDGFMITNINGANISDSTILRSKLVPCSLAGETLIYNGSQWVCGTLSINETDPFSIRNYNLTLSSQTASFWISSGTVDYFYIKNNLDAYQTARLNPNANGLFVSISGNIGIGNSNPTNKLTVTGDVNIDNGGKDAIKVDSLGNVGIGTDTPTTKFEVVGDDQSGMISVYKAGNKQIGFFRKK